MIKEAALFVVSAGALVYFVTPTSESAKPQSVESIPAVKAEQSEETDDDDEWGYDDDDAAEEFVMGEPLIRDDDDYQLSEDEDTGGSNEDAGDDEEDEWSPKKRSSKSEKAPQIKRSVHPDSPQPGQIGSAERPRVLKTDNPEDGDDD